MANRLKAKLKSKKGSGNAVIALFIVVALFNIIYLAYSRDNSQYKRWVRTFEEGIRVSSKAALLQYDYTSENFENISMGYIDGESEFNHFIELNHDKANDIFFEMLYTSTKSHYSITELKNFITLAILEPKRKKDLEGNYLKDQWEYEINLYKNDMEIEKDTLGKEDFYRVQNIINSNTTDITIDLSYGTLINKIKPRTYYIAVVENLPLKGLFMYSDRRSIDMYYFEGVNAVRSLDIREGN